MGSGDEFVLDLARRLPWFQDPLEAYVDDSEDRFEYVFLAVEVTPEVIAAYVSGQNPGGPTDVDWRAVLAFLDEWYVEGGAEVRNVIKSSFLLQLPYPGEHGYGIVDDLPVGLKSAFREVRADG